MILLSWKPLPRLQHLLLLWCHVSVRSSSTRFFSITGISMAAGLSSSSPVPTKPVSPYGAFNGQVRGCVYQPTEIALIAKGLTKASARARVLSNVPRGAPPPDTSARLHRWTRTQ